MKNILTLVLSFWLINISGQVTTSVTYTAGDLTSDYDIAPTTSMTTLCPDTITINIPAGDFVTGIDVSYDITAAGGAWRSEQRSYLSCISTSTSETTMYTGTGNVSGTESYSRTGLNIANGTTATGELKFVLYLYRTWGGILNCDGFYQVVDNNTWTIDVHHGIAPSCPAPANLSSSNIATNSADISWTTGGATDWQIEYGAAGFGLGSGTLITSSTNPHTLSGLSSSTTYDVYVRDSCGPGDLSTWTGPLTFTTTCGVNAAPYFENFNGTSWVSGTGANNGGNQLGNCWTRNTTPGTYHWGSRTAGTPSLNTGPTGDHPLGTGNYVYTEATSTGGPATLVSPEIDLGGLTIPELTFAYHMFGADMGTLNIDIHDGTTWNNSVFVLTGQQQTAATDAWNIAVVSLTPYLNDTIRVRFSATRGAGFRSDMAIDDFRIRQQPTCPAPSLLSSTAQTSTSVDLSWTSGGASNWQIEYGPTGFTPGSGTLVSATTNPFTVTGLTPSTSYDFYVRDSCGPGDVSVWSLPLLATTFCAPTPAPWSENFDGANFNTAGAIGTIDNCFDRTPLTVFLWQPGPVPFPPANTGPSGDHTTGSGQYMITSVIGFPALPATAEFTTPLIDLSPLTAPELTFWYHMYGVDIDPTGQLSVDIFDGDTWTNGVITFTGQQQSASTDPWKEAVVNLSAYANDTIRIRLTAIKTLLGVRNGISVDDLDIHEQPNCPRPTSLSAIPTNSTSVSVGWTSGGASNWQIEYGPAGFAPGSGTVVTVTTNPYLITGLSANTNYDFYVRDSCGASDLSAWAGPATANTSCGVQNAPYHEDFESAPWVSGTSFNNIGNTIDSCWIRSSVPGFYHWGTRTGSTPSFNTGPTGDNTTGSGKYIYVEGGSAGSLALIESPYIDLSPLTIPELTFAYHMYGAGIGSLDVDVFDGTNWNNAIFTISGQQQTATTDPWLTATVSLSAYANTSIKLRFTANQGPTTLSDIAIDDVDIHEQPACPLPSGLSTSNITSNSVELSWTSGGASNWQIEYGPAGFSHGSGTLLNATSNPFTITGLTPNTTYDFYVRDSCGVNDVSIWSLVASATTICGVFTAPWSEDFEGPAYLVNIGVGAIDNCWSRTPVSLFYWQPGPIPGGTIGTGPSGDHTTGSGKFMYSRITGGTTTLPITAELTTPTIDLSALTTPELTFWYHMFGASIGTTGSIEVDVHDGTSWTNGVFTLVGQQQSAMTDPWLEAIVDLSAYANDTIQLRFKAVKTVTGFFNMYSIDDLDIHEKPNCPKPSILTASNATTTSISLSWTTGGATDWNIEYGPAGFTLGSGTLLPVNSNPYVVNGLSPSVAYDFYVRDSCGPGDVSPWLGPLTANTLCGIVVAPYSENFDNATWAGGTGGANFGDLVNPCWDRDTTGAIFHWGVKSGPTVSGPTGPSSGNGGSGKYIYTEATYGGGPTTIESPQIDLSPLSNPRMTFAYHMYGANMGTLEIDIHDGSSWNNAVFSISGEQHTATTDPWTLDTLDLSAYAGDTITIRFKGIRGTGFAGDMAVDDVKVIDIAPCPDPINLQALNITHNSADIDFTSTALASHVLWGPSGIAPGSGGTLVKSINSSPYALTGLTPNTNYWFYVRDSCGAGSMSTWVGPIAFTTLPCPTIVASFTPTHNGFSVFFDAGSSSGGQSWQWDLGDGTTASGDTLTHVYTKDSTYTVTLIHSSLCGSDTLMLPIAVCGPMSAAFTTSSTYLSADLDASVSTGTPVQWDWDFGDGSPMGSGQLVNHIYPANGTYNARLIVQNLCGETDTLMQTVTVCDTLKADISLSFTGLNFTYDGSGSSPGATSYTWHTGDGTVLTGQIANHTYASAGIYTVSLVVENICGDKDSISLGNVRACEPPVARWTYNIIPGGTSGMRVQFDGSASSGANDYYWDFGDGNTTNGTALPVHNYAISGLFYRVTLVVTNICGDTDTMAFRLNEIGIDELERLNNNLSLYPNPARDVVHIQIKDSHEDHRIEIISANGRRIYSELLKSEFGEFNHSIDLRKYSRGFYIIKIHSTSGVLRRRIVLD